MSIPYEERRAVYEAAIAQYGKRGQIWMAVEEMSELTKELAKLNRPKGTTVEALVDELADVTIMLEQLRLIFKANETVQARIDFKVQRLQERLERERGSEPAALPALLPRHVELLRALARWDLNVTKAAHALCYSRSSLYYTASVVQDRTGLDPLKFYDLQMLLALYTETEGAGTVEDL